MSTFLKPIPADDLALVLKPGALVCVYSYPQITSQLRRVAGTALWGQWEPTGTMAPIGVPLTLLHLEYPLCVVRHALPCHAHTPPFHLDLRNCSLSLLSSSYLAALTPTNPPLKSQDFGTPIHLPLDGVPTTP